MLIATAWARSAFMLATWITSIFAIITIAASFYFERCGWALRLARSVALALAIHHWFFAPGDGTCGRLLWGNC
jgi:hypothetical protein